MSEEREERVPRPAELVIMSWGGGWDRGLQRAVSGPFRARTGIAVRHETHVGLPLPRHLLAPLRAGQRPPFDVVWSNAVPAMKAGLEGLSDPLTTEDVPNLAALHPRARPETAQEGDAGWPLALAYVVYYVLAYRRAAFPAGAPESWEVLLDPRHRGKIALYPGGNGFFPVAQVLGGGAVGGIPESMDLCWRYLHRLAPQVGTLDYSMGMGEMLRRGDLDLCFRALPNALAFREEGLDVAWTAPREGIPDTADALWVPRHLPAHVAYWAKRYVNFALSRPVQEQWCEMLGVIPMHADAAPPRVLRERVPVSLDAGAGILHVPELVKLAHEQAWTRRFNQILGQTSGG